MIKDEQKNLNSPITKPEHSQSECKIMKMLFRQQEN